jgi:hypothetical protein
MFRMFRKSALLSLVFVIVLVGAIGGAYAVFHKSPAPSPKTSSITVRGTVACRFHDVVGVWVESSGGGSGWASWSHTTNGWTAAYSIQIKNTTLPTSLRLHVGCGGSPMSWWSDNRTPGTSVAGSGTYDASCSEGSTRPATGDNTRCRWGITSTSSSPSSSQPQTYSETEWIHHSVNTFTDYHNASGQGPSIAAGQVVQVSCKVLDGTIKSVNPDGYWYRVASRPWSNHYYVPANVFLNGDPPNGPYSHNTDFAVPDCSAA